MLAFVYYVNGKKLCTAGIGGPGVVATHVDLVRSVASKSGKKAMEDLSLHVGGLHSRTHTHVTWLHRQLREGDSVRVDIVEVPRVNRPRKRKLESPQVRKKRERDYVIKKAESWGWKIQK